MRRPRDYDSELKAVDHKARQLKARKVAQLGELVVATGADALPVEVLAGALLGAVSERKTETKEAWRASGVGWFQRAIRGARSIAGGSASKPAAGSSPQSADRNSRAD